MKKNISILSILIILITSLFSSFVSADTNKVVNMIIDGTNVNFNTVNLQLDKKPINSDVPPVIYNDRTLVPIHVIRNLGIDVQWENSTRKVTIITEDKTVVMQIDNSSAVINGVKESLPDNVPPKIFTYKGNGRTMVPIAFFRKIGMMVEWDAKTRTVNMNLTQNNSTSEEKPVHINTIKDLDINFIDNKPVVRVQTDNKLNYKILKLENPARLVVDFEDTKFDIEDKGKLASNGTFQIDTNRNGVIRIRAAQFQNDPFITRIVLELDEMKEYQMFYDTNTKEMVLELKRTDSPDIEIEEPNNDDIETEEPNNNEEDPGSNEGTENKTAGLEYKKINSIMSRIVMVSHRETEFDFSVRDYGRLLLISVPKEDIEIPTDIVHINDSLVKNVVITEDMDNGQYNIQVSLKENVDYKVESPRRTQEYVIDLSVRKNRGTPLIVIDPGHGGTAPGATSPINNLVEKDIVLDMSQRLDKLLRNAGYNTYMIRNSDTTVSLADRAGVANKLQADLFISIHANAVVGNDEVNGIETLYARDNKHVAEIFQRELINYTGANDRGVKHRPNLVVLRDTEMPAILVETGFLTNKAEAEKLATSSYRQTIAESLFQATRKYF